MATQWVTEPAACNFEYQVTTKSGPTPDPDDLKIIAFEGSKDTPEIKVTVTILEVFLKGAYAIDNYNAGVFIVEARALADNGYSTNFF